MLSYLIIDIGYASNVFFILTILLGYKRSRKTLPAAFVIFYAHYIIIEVFCQLARMGVDMKLSFIIAGYYEILGTFVLLCLFTSGHVWRNYTILICAFMALNALTGVLISFSPNLSKSYAGYIVNENIALNDSVWLTLILVFSGFIVSVIMSKFIKKEYNGTSKVYMIFVLAYSVLGIAQVVYKQNTMFDALENGGIRHAVKLVYIVMGVTSLYLLALLYYHFEKKRMDKENTKLEAYINDNMTRYKELVADNEKLSKVKNEIIDYTKELDEGKNQAYKEELKSLAGEVSNIALTGNIVIDALIKDSYEKGKDEGVKFEIIPGNVSFDKDKIISSATIVENMLLIAKDFAKESKNKWIYLSFRQNGDMLLVKTEFSKNHRDKLSVCKSILIKPTEFMQRLKLVKSVAESMCGTVSIVNKDDEGSISVLLNNA